MAYFAKREKLKKCQIFDQKHGLTPLEKWKFSDLFILMFLWSRGAIIISRTLPNRFSQPILRKKKS